jgi:hypothetical protein
VLGVVAVTVGSARQAVGLLRGARSAGLRVLTAQAVVVTSDADRIPAGLDGEAVWLPVPVRAEIRPGALRVRVPRDRPGVPPPKPAISLTRLRRLASWPRWPRPGRQPGSPPLEAGHGNTAAQVPDARRLRAGRRPSVRADAGSAAVGADDHL